MYPRSPCGGAEKKRVRLANHFFEYRMELELGIEIVEYPCSRMLSSASIPDFVVGPAERRNRQNRPQKGAFAGIDATDFVVLSDAGS